MESSPTKLISVIIGLSVVSDKLVYKSAGEYIITLRLENSKTNENRSDVVDHMFAKFRCDRAFVVEIRGKFTDELIPEIGSDNDSKFIYRQGEYVSVNDYDEKYNEICTNGIHYYISHKAAFFHNNDEIENG